ncbi:serine hydrolase domain-containing protein, partial [Dokdonella sp.]|uniref:serine hydrolase domain-containing protein n=1 Tax=Dokdonella sp. TaxID=2291710 RepID=UPI003C4583A3
SILINRLIQEGRLSLTATVGDFIDLTTLPGHTADPRLANVTVRNLLEHLAGFRTYDSLRDPMFADPQIAADVGIGLPVGTADIIRAMNGIPLGSQPGATFSYSNYGYMLLGRIIEDVTSMSYENYAKSVFAPIGVRNMRLGRSQLSLRAPNEVGYNSGIMRTTVMDDSGALVPYEYGAFNIENMDSHGGWISSAVEMVRIASNLDNPSASDAILDQASISRMFSLPENYPLPYQLGNPYYAHGWSVRNYGNGKYNTWHDGSLPGTTSYMVRIQDGWDYVAIFNRRDETGASCISCETDNAMWGVRDQIANWPDIDLFPKMLSVIFTSGFD